VAACDTFSSEPLADGTYRLTYSDPLGQPHSLEANLGWRADSVCPNGWEKLRDTHYPAGPDGPATVWIVRCTGADAAAGGKPAGGGGTSGRGAPAGGASGGSSF